MHVQVIIKVINCVFDKCLRDKEDATCTTEVDNHTHGRRPMINKKNLDPPPMRCCQPLLYDQQNLGDNLSGPLCKLMLKTPNVRYSWARQFFGLNQIRIGYNSYLGICNGLTNPTHLPKVLFKRNLFNKYIFLSSFIKIFLLAKGGDETGLRTFIYMLHFNYVHYSGKILKCNMGNRLKLT